MDANSHFETKFALRSFLDIPIFQARLIFAFRHAVICHALHKDPYDHLIRQYRSIAIAKKIVALTTQIQAIWPYNFMVMRPCCRVLSPDEATLCDGYACASARNFPAFATVTTDILPAKTARQLYTRMVLLSAALE